MGPADTKRAAQSSLGRVALAGGLHGRDDPDSQRKQRRNHDPRRRQMENRCRIDEACNDQDNPNEVNSERHEHPECSKRATAMKLETRLVEASTSTRCPATPPHRGELHHSRRHSREVSSCPSGLGLAGEAVQTPRNTWAMRSRSGAPQPSLAPDSLGAVSATQCTRRDSSPQRLLQRDHEIF